jgi:phosphoribosylanthranilate isomerase
MKVALTVDPRDPELENLFSKFPVDILQLHGHESPNRVKEIKEKYGVPIIKSLSLRTKYDLEKIHEYTSIADQILIDAAKPGNLSPPGGNGVVFDWRLISGYNWRIPWLLAGGLNHKNVSGAIKVSGAKQVDVSSGVESKPGVKDRNLIKEFARVARGERHNG